MPDALKKADEVLQQAVQGITDLINVPGLINLDFADVRTVMANKGIAHIGIGKAKGDDKAVEAVKMAVTSPLLETTIEGASHVIINVSGDIGLMEANEAASYVEEMAGSEANIIFGAMYDDSRQDEATITIIATGLDSQPSAREAQKTQQSIKPTTNYNYKPQTNTTQFRTQMGMGNDMGIQQSKPSINFDVPPRPASSVTEKDIQIPTFLQKNRNK